MSHFTPWESAGMPVQPAYCSSPNDRTTTGLSRVPVSASLFSVILLRESPIL